MGIRPKQTFFPKKMYRWPKACEKMLNRLVNHEGNTNQNSEIPPHTCQNGCYQKEKKYWWRKGSPCALLV